ncbi:hypothetical protein SLA2020_425520 [Shorea laevis]
MGEFKCDGKVPPSWELLGEAVGWEFSKTLDNPLEAILLSPVTAGEVIMGDVEESDITCTLKTREAGGVTDVSGVVTADFTGSLRGCTVLVGGSGALLDGSARTSPPWEDWN